MKRKLTRIDIINYCQNCKHVKSTNRGSICGLTNQPGLFEFDCDKFEDKNQVKKRRPIKSWLIPLAFSILSSLRLLHNIINGESYIFGLIFLISATGWLLIAIFSKK